MFDTLPPVTLPELAKLEAVRVRLNAALRTQHTLTGLRGALIELSSELEDALDPDRAPPTERAPLGYPMPWEGDVAPSTPRASELGEEYGA